MKNKLLIKKLIISLLVVIVLDTVILNGYSQERRWGDVNADGIVNVIDALLAAQCSAGFILPVFYWNEGDVNCDNNNNIVDALLIAKYVAGLIPTLACTPTPRPTVTPTPYCTPCLRSVTAHVKYAETGLPVYHAMVQLSPNYSVGSVFDYTDSNGNISLSSPLTCNLQNDFTVYVIFSGYSGTPTPVTIECNTTGSVEIALKAVTVPPCTYCDMIVSGTVKDIHGYPVAGAVIGTPSPTDAVSDANGNYTLVLSYWDPGCSNLMVDYQFRAIALGYSDTNYVPGSASQLEGHTCGSITKNFVLAPTTTPLPIATPAPTR